MKYRDLRDFMRQLEAVGELRRVTEPLSARLEMTALADRVCAPVGQRCWLNIQWVTKYPP